MTEIDILKMLIATLNAQLVAGASSLTVNMPAGITVQEAPQSRQEGVPSNPVVIITHVPGTKLIGSPRRHNMGTNSDGVMYRAFEQLKESTYQIGALVPQTPSDVDALTASDVLQVVAILLASDTTQKTLLANNCGMLRIREVQSLWFSDDRRQWEDNPHFDITLVHTLKWQEQIGIIDAIDATVTPI